jgi:DNA-binding transcriptional ArsR family regulator
MLGSDEAVIESELKGKTLLVYLHLLKQSQSSVGVREVQRALSFSSPSVAAYHLNKLQELGLVESDRGDYRVTREIKIGVLRHFVTLGGVMLPRFLFYAVLMTTMLVTYVLQFPMNLSRQNVTTLLMGAVPALILWYETIRIWKQKPT